MNILQKAENVVKNNIYHTLGLTVERELNIHPDILSEAQNYYPVNENGEKDDNGEYPELLEFWAVSDWLMEKLAEKGEVVFPLLDFNVWGRQTSGQSIHMDAVIQDIAKDRSNHYGNK